MSSRPGKEVLNVIVKDRPIFSFCRLTDASLFFMNHDLTEWEVKNWTEYKKQWQGSEWLTVFSNLLIFTCCFYRRCELAL